MHICILRSSYKSFVLRKKRGDIISLTCNRMYVRKDVKKEEER